MSAWYFNCHYSETKLYWHFDLLIRSKYNTRVTRQDLYPNIANEYIFVFRGVDKPCILTVIHTVVSIITNVGHRNNRHILCLVSFLSKTIVFKNGRFREIIAAWRLWFSQNFCFDFLGWYNSHLYWKYFRKQTNKIGWKLTVLKVI